VFDPEVNRSFTVADLARLIADKQPFAFSRWGDGEWHAVTAPSARKANCDGHKYFPEMGQALADVLKRRPSYILGFQHWPPRVRRPWCEWLEKQGLTDLKWVEANIFHFAAQAGDWCFRAWPDVMLGPSHLRNVFPSAQFITVPKKNCWLSTGRLMAELADLLDLRKEHTVVGYCGSMAANSWIDIMFHEFGDKHSHIDFGSVFDPLGGVYSRRYMRRAHNE
jgi:hypothetical protein